MLVLVIVILILKLIECAIKDAKVNDKVKEAKEKYHMS